MINFILNNNKIVIFCLNSDCRYCFQTSNLQEEFLRNKFSTENRTHDDWLMIYFRNNKYQITLFPVLKNGFRKNNSQIFCRK